MLFNDTPQCGMSACTLDIGDGRPTVQSKMFDTAELGRVLDKAAYDEQVPELRTRLLQVQHSLLGADFPVVVLLHGVDAAGRGEVLNLLHEWFDARYLVTQAYEPPNEAERERPRYWRYWQWLPPHGKIGLFLGSWYTEPLNLRAHGKSGQKAYIDALREAAAFEKTLVDDGALFIKFWLHISKSEQKRRLDAYAASPHRRYRVRKSDWLHHELYEQFETAAGRAIRETSTAEAPWTIVESADNRFRDVTLARHLVQRISARLEQGKSDGPRVPNPHVPDPVTILDTLDLTKKLPEQDYESRHASAQAELNHLSRRLLKKKQSAIFVFEGWDAAGKGGAIRRVTRALDARQYRIIPIAAPNDEERAHHYLWRFWRHLPARGRITIYDRSWYGRVLVERVEGFATEAEWRRAYKELNDFEEQLADDGTTIVKFWLHISRDEQMRRFQAREAEPWKQYKITPDDFRNRERSNQYETAVNDMLAATDTDYAPWALIEAEDKHFARVKVLETICKRLAANL